MFQCCDKVLKVWRFYNIINSELLLFPLRILRLWNMVRLHFMLFLVAIKAGKRLSFLTENRGGLWESFVATSLLLSHKRRCSRGDGGEGSKVQTTKSIVLTLKLPCCLTQGVTTSSANALLFENGEYSRHLHLEICTCKTCPRCTVKLVWDVEIKWSFTKINKLAFLRACLSQKKKKRSKEIWIQDFRSAAAFSFCKQRSSRRS